MSTRLKKFLFGLVVMAELLIAQRGYVDAIPIQMPGSSGRLSWSPAEPKEGEIISLTFEITSSVDAPELQVSFVPTNNNVKFIGPAGYAGSIKKGETKRVAVKIKFNRPVAGVWAIATIRNLKDGFKMPSGKIEYIATLSSQEFSLYFDTLTNTFVSYKEYWSRRAKPKPPLPPEYTYDIVAGMHTKDILPEVEAKKIRIQIDSLKQLDSTLTDEESLEMLHDVEVQMLVRYGISKKEESVPILIKARKLIKEQNLSKWEAVDKVIEEEKQKGRINFFRPDMSGNTDYAAGSDSTPKQKTDVTLTGTIKYRKHLIDKDIGLDTTTVDMPLRFTKVFFWTYWSGTGGHFVGPALTDNNGQFTYTVGGVVLPGARFMPVVFLRGPSVPPGPSGFNRVKVISDTLKFTWIPAPEDSQTWRFRWKVDTVDVSYYDFGTKYCAEHFLDGGLWPDNHQPRSGAANIYDQLLTRIIHTKF